MDTNNSSQQTSTSKKTSLGSTAFLLFLDMVIRQEEENIRRIQKEMEALEKHLLLLRNQEAKKDGTSEGEIDTKGKWKKINDKYNDTQKFYTELIAKVNLGEAQVTPASLDNLTNLYRIVVNNFNSIRPFFDGRYENLLGQLSSASEDKKKQISEKLSDLKDTILSREQEFNQNYDRFIKSSGTIDYYKEYAKKEVSELLEKDNVNLKEIKGAELTNSRQRLDRVKFLIYYDKYRQLYSQGKPIRVPLFPGLEKYYSEDGTISPENFPEFFKELTGLNFSYIDLENEIKADEIRQKLTAEEISRLKDHERLQLKIDLEGEEEDSIEEEERRSILSSLQDNEDDDEDDLRKKLKKKAKRLKVDVTIATDPYLSKDPLIQERAKRVNDVMEDLIANGNFRSLISLSSLPSLDPVRPDVAGMVKHYAKEKFTLVKNVAIDKVKSKVDELEVGSKVIAGGKKVVIKVADKSRYVKRVRRRAKKSGLGLFSYIVKRLIEKTVGKVVDVVKNGLRTIRNTQSVVRAMDYIKGTSLGQRIQSLSTGTVGVVRDIITKGNIVYRNVMRNPLVTGAMDAGHITKTAIKKLPSGIMFGAGASSIALSLGVSSSLIAPIFVGSSLLGIGLETINDIMHSPLKRVPGGLIRWIQSHGSAIYRNADRSFSPELLQNSPLAKAGQKINAIGTRAGRVFGAVTTGFRMAMIAATIAGLLGINPVLAAGLTFGTVATVKFASQTVIGRRIVERVLSEQLVRLGLLPLQTIIGQVFSTQIFANLLQDLIKWLRSGRSLEDFFSKYFTFGGNKNFFEKFNAFNSYMASIAYFGSYSSLVRYIFGGLFGSRLAALNIPGLQAVFGSTGLGTGLKGFLMGSLRSFVAPTAIFVVSSIAGLALAAALGIPIGGIGAAIGATAGGLLGIGIGLVLGAGTPLAIPLAAVFNAAGTAIGAWVGSFFDKAVKSTFNGVFAVISGISFLFTLIDILNNRSINPRKLAMMSISLALSIPTLASIIDKGSTSQIESDPTLPTPTAIAFLTEEGQASIQVVNRTSYPLNNNEVERLSTAVKKELLSTSGLDAYLIFTDSDQSSALVNDNALLLTVSVREQNPLDRVSALITDLNLGN